MYTQVLSLIYPMQLVLFKTPVEFRDDHWRDAKKVMRYLHRTKDFMLVYINSDDFEI